MAGQRSKGLRRRRAAKSARQLFGALKRQNNVEADQRTLSVPMCQVFVSITTSTGVVHTVRQRHAVPCTALWHCPRRPLSTKWELAYMR